MELYNILSKLKKHTYFDRYSDIYVDEFFMYISVKSIKSIKGPIFPTIEIYKILSELPLNLIEKINEILISNDLETVNITNFKYFNNDYYLNLGQDNLIENMKEIFNHNCISDKIEKINLKIKYNEIDFIINVHNNDKIIDIKDDIREHLLINNKIKINTNRIILKYNNLIIENINNDLNFYNITNNSIIYILINMDNKQMI